MSEEVAVTLGGGEEFISYDSVYEALEAAVDAGTLVIRARGGVRGYQLDGGAA
jgi:hypothetical protein